MSDNNKKFYQLAIETAVSGGSLTLSENEKEIDCWIGDGRVSKVEDVLRQIEYLFEKNDISKNTLNAIRVSRGPGSYTGARIGIATALGLQKALRCHLDGVSVLEAMSSLNPELLPGIAAVPVGTRRAAWQLTGGEGSNFEIPVEPAAPHLTSVEELISLLCADRSPASKRLIIHRDLYETVVEDFYNIRHETNFELIKVDNLSSLLNVYCQSLEQSKNPTASYASDNVSAIYLVNKQTELP